MSMTEQGLHFYVRSNPLGDALAVFNETFDYDLRLPALPEHIAAAADLAELRGRGDIADDLRTALKQTLLVGQ